MSDVKPWSGPGVILGFFKLRDPARISEETLEEWFEKEYMPEILATGAVKTAWLYQAANADYDKQHLIVYKVPDLALVPAAQKDIARTSKLSLFEGPVDNYIEVDSRIYSMVQLYETTKRDADAASVIMLAMMQPPPGGEADLEAWYRDEHNEQMSKEPGWWRTSRFSLLNQSSTGKEPVKELSFLAIHEFVEGNQLGTEVKALEPISDWTKKVMGEATAIDAAITTGKEVLEILVSVVDLKEYS